MAALRLNSTDTDAFVQSLNSKLIQYCQQFGVDTGGTPTTAMYSSVIANGLPLGFDHNFKPSNHPPCSPVEYGSGGVVSTGNDMLAFLLYQMSGSPLQNTYSTVPNYCSGGAGAGPPCGYGWFHREFKVNGQSLTAVCKNGGVSGFTAWIGFQQPTSGQASPLGIFALTNGPDGTHLGLNAFSLLMGGGEGAIDPLFPIGPERAFDPRVH